MRGGLGRGRGWQLAGRGGARALGLPLREMREMTNECYTLHHVL